MTMSAEEFEKLTASPEAEITRLRRALEVAVSRVETLVGRVLACREKHPDAHAVTAIEGPAWIEEGRKALEPGSAAWNP